MTTTTIKVSDVVVHRDFEPDPLPDGIPARTINQPIIVRGDNVLVDGLRRLRRAQEKGTPTVPAIISSNYEVLVAALKAQHEDVGHETTPRRVWEIYESIYRLGITWSRQQYNGGWKKLPGGGRVRREPGAESPTDGGIRKLFLEAFSFSDSMFGHITNLYRQAEGGNVAAQELAVLVDLGELSPQRATHRLRRPYNMVGNVTNEREQFQLLERGTAGLAAQVDALLKMGFPILVPAEELTKFYQEIYKSRTKLTEFINGIRKVLKEAEVQNG